MTFLAALIALGVGVTLALRVWWAGLASFIATFVALRLLISTTERLIRLKYLVRLISFECAKSDDLPADIAKKFLFADKIDTSKFRENYDYYVKDVYGDHKPSQSCFHHLDLPMGYPYWFASAYPDVVKYFSNLEDRDLVDFFQNIGFTEQDFTNYVKPKLYDHEESYGHFKAEALYEMKEHYKKVHPNTKLECQ